MMIHSEPGYTKYAYWLRDEEERRLRDDMKHRHVEVQSAKGIVCTPLREPVEISSVAPEVWNHTCARQGSWYRASDKNGLYLVVSSVELTDYAHQKAATITRSNFEPPRLASLHDKEQMIEDPGFSAQIPLEWREVDEREKRVYLKWAKRFGSRAKEYRFLYLSHTANHGNFVRPRFAVESNGDIVPYSIDRSAHLCSCCLELFQVIGASHPRKLVAPCPGAAVFAGLAPDRYLLVESA